MHDLKYVSRTNMISYTKKKGLSFISNCQRLKEGTFCASELAEIEPTPPAPKGAGYARLDHSATVGHHHKLYYAVRQNGDFSDM